MNLEYYNKKAEIIDDIKHQCIYDDDTLPDEQENILIDRLENLDKSYNIEITDIIKEEYKVLIESLINYIEERYNDQE